MSETSAAERDEMLQNTLQNNWRTLLVVGVAVGVLGLVATIIPFVTGVSLALLVGAVLVVDGILHFVGAFDGRGWRGFVWQVALGALSLVAGLVVLLDPVFGLLTLTLLVIGYLLASGVVEVAMGLRLRGERNWVWSVVSGVVGVVLAVLLWVGFPSTALWAVGVLFGVNLLVTGASMAALALGARGLASATSGSPSSGVGGV